MTETKNSNVKGRRKNSDESANTNYSRNKEDLYRVS
jgi:hypothetical protein